MNAPLLRQWAARLGPYTQDIPELKRLHEQILRTAEQLDQAAAEPRVAESTPWTEPPKLTLPPDTSSPLLCEGAGVKLVVSPDGLVAVDASEELTQFFFDKAVEEKISTMQGVVSVPVEVLFLSMEEEAEYLGRKDKGR